MNTSPWTEARSPSSPTLIRARTFGADAKASVLSLKLAEKADDEIEPLLESATEIAFTA